MAATEIEKLERRYADNPQGLTFAPLAEVHRKNGEVARALELLRAGLELHPNYIPASIVLGRCHWDMGDLPAAETAFSHVLRLDDENVIALKSLADINERLERFSEAQRWLNRLISVDRSNEEARHQLARIEAAKQKPAPVVVPLPRPATSPPPVPVEPSPTLKAPAPEPPGEVPHLELTAAIEEPAPIAAEEPAPIPPEKPAAQKVEAKAAVLQFLDTSEPPPQAAGPLPIIGEETTASAEEPAPVDGLISQEFVPPKDNTYRLHPELTQDFLSAGQPADQLEVETAAEVELQSSGASEFRVPNAAEDFMDLGAPPSPPPLDPEFIELAASPASARPDPEFIDLAAPPPPPPSPARAPAAAMVAVPTPRETMPEPKRSSYSVRETRGQSVALFFKTMLSARPPGSSGSAVSEIPAPTDGAAPARPPQDALTSKLVLGEESQPVPPAVPAAGPPQDAAVSFDDFFNAAGAGSSPLPKGSPEPGKDDLDQFQSWLQNLKR
jgi:hypothetical protein